LEIVKTTHDQEFVSNQKLSKSISFFELYYFQKLTNNRWPSKGRLSKSVSLFKCKFYFTVTDCWWVFKKNQTFFCL